MKDKCRDLVKSLMEAEATLLHFSDRGFPGPVIENDMVHGSYESCPVGSGEAMDENRPLPVLNDAKGIDHAGFIDLAGFQRDLMEDKGS